MICTCTCTCNLQYLHFPPPFLFARCSSNFVPFWVQFSVHFVFHFGVHFGSKIGSKTVLFWFHFWNPFFWGLEALQVPLESLPEPLILLLRASKTRKVWFSYCKITLFENDAFWYFKVHHALIGVILVHLGPLWLQNGPQNWPQNGPKMDPKWNQNLFHFWSHFWVIFGPFWGPFWGQKIYRRNTQLPRKCGFTMVKLHFLQKWHDFYVNFKMHVIWMWMRFGSRFRPISN